MDQSIREELAKTRSNLATIGKNLPGCLLFVAFIALIVWAIFQPGEVKVMLPWHATAYMK